MQESENQVNPDYVDAPYEASGCMKTEDGRLVWFHDKEVGELEFQGKVIERRNQDTGELIEKYLFPFPNAQREMSRLGRPMRWYRAKRWAKLKNARAYNPETQAFDKLPPMPK